MGLDFLSLRHHVNVAKGLSKQNSCPSSQETTGHAWESTYLKRNTKVLNHTLVGNPAWEMRFMSTIELENYRGLGNIHLNLEI